MTPRRSRRQDCACAHVHRLGPGSPRRGRKPSAGAGNAPADAGAILPHTEESADELKALVDTAVDGMFTVIEPLGVYATTLPAGHHGVGDGYTPTNSGPCSSRARLGAGVRRCGCRLHWILGRRVGSHANRYTRARGDRHALAYVRAYCPTLAATSTPTPTLAPTPEGTVAVDVVFVEPSGLEGAQFARSWALDVYAGDSPAQAVVVILNGASANKATPVWQQLARDIADSGTVVFLVDFRKSGARSMFTVAGGAPFREAFDAAECAIRFAHDRAGEYGSQTDRVIVLGQSAGGLLGMWLAVVGDDVDAVWGGFVQTRGGPVRQLECVAADASAAAESFVGYAGAYRIMETMRDLDEELAGVFDPTTHVGRHTGTRIRALHGTQDLLTPPEFVPVHEDLIAELQAAGQDATWMTIEAGHFLDDDSYDTILQTVIDEVRAP